MEISNKTLALFLVAAIVVSLAGTIISLNKLGQVTTTGFAATDTGTATLQVNSTTSIFFSIDSINWGSGYVNGSYINCTMGSDNKRSLGCVGFTTVAQGFVLENDGNKNVTVELVANATAAQFIEGSTGGGPEFLYNVSNNETDACDTPAPAALTAVNTSAPGTLICDIFHFIDADTMRIDVEINIPSDSPPGVKIAEFTATAT